MARQRRYWLRQSQRLQPQGALKLLDSVEQILGDDEHVERRLLDTLQPRHRADKSKASGSGRTFRS